MIHNAFIRKHHNPTGHRECTRHKCIKAQPYRRIWDASELTKNNNNKTKSILHIDQRSTMKSVFALCFRSEIKWMFYRLCEWRRLTKSIRGALPIAKRMGLKGFSSRCLSLGECARQFAWAHVRLENDVESIFRGKFWRMEWDDLPFISVSTCRQSNEPNQISGSVYFEMRFYWPD